MTPVLRLALACRRQQTLRGEFARHAQQGNGEHGAEQAGYDQTRSQHAEQRPACPTHRRNNQPASSSRIEKYRPVGLRLNAFDLQETNSATHRTAAKRHPSPCRQPHRDNRHVAVELPQFRRAEITVLAGHQFVAGSSNNTDGTGYIGGGEGS